MKQRWLWFTKALFVVLVVLFIPQVAQASAYFAGALVQVSGESPFVGNCGLAGQTETNENYPDSEVEPYVDVNPKDGTNLIGAWQQDRWSDGGSRGNVVGASFDSGATWQIVPETKNSQCTDGTPENGGFYERASDPWVTISPDGTAYLMSLSIDQDPTSFFGANPDAMLVSKSIDGGKEWSDPITLIRDTNPNRLNDKNSMTADPNNPNYVYAIWDRLESPPSGNTNPIAGENAIAYRGPTLFTRTINGGISWEEPRIIFDPGTLQQTLGNQIVVLPKNETFEGDELVNVFNLIQNTRKGATRGFNVSVIRSEDNGKTWSKPIRFERMVNPGVSDPEGGFPVRTGDIIPDIAVDPNSGQLYAVWQDERFDLPQQHDSIALSTSTDGGRTWTEAVKVNKTPMGIPSGNQQAFTPAVDVAEDGTVSVTYYDFRNNTEDTDSLLTDYWVVHCHPAPPPDNCSRGEQYGNEIRLTDTSFDMERAPVARGYFVGDYEGLANAGADFAPFFSQTHEGDPASIFFRRVVPGPVGP